VLLLDNDDTVSIGSRGVCYAKRTLEVLDRMGLRRACVDKGVSWNVGRTFFGEGEVFNFNLRPQEGHQRPGMINLQQYYLEEYLVSAPASCPTWRCALRTRSSACRKTMTRPRCAWKRPTAPTP
jgi:3-(3-hydroxy-phenyl)propionate hydroxylase